jgi:3'(2'), 5'-bisphosphate nucleotidase
MTDPDDHQVASDLATRAGEALVELRSELVDAGAEGRELKDAGDRASHELLMELLGDVRPDDAVLSEEGKDNAERLTAERVWIIDPLDGTREFGEPPRTDWAVHVALVEAGVPTAGAVALPALGVTLSTAAPPAPLPVPVSGVRIICSRTRPGPSAELLAERLGAELIYMGSAGAKAMAVVRGDADIYAHTGGQYEWDSCAPVAVATSAGLYTSRIDGSPLVYNCEDPYLPDLLICRPELTESILQILGE